MFHYIYKIINNINDKYYYGKRTCKYNPEQDLYMGSSIHLKQAIKKYGKDNFTKIILGYTNTEKQAYEFEERLIKQSDISSNMCYNLHSGGKGFKLNDILVSKNPNYGKHHSIKHKNLIRNKLLGRYVSIETRLKRSKSMIGKNKGYKVAQLNKDTLEVIKIYDYAALAEADGFNRKNIYKCCNEKQKTHQNYKWKYIKEII